MTLTSIEVGGGGGCWQFVPGCWSSGLVGSLDIAASFKQPYNTGNHKGTNQGNGLPTPNHYYWFLRFGTLWFSFKSFTTVLVTNKKYNSSGNSLSTNRALGDLYFLRKVVSPRMARPPLVKSLLWNRRALNWWCEIPRNLKLVEIFPEFINSQKSMIKSLRR